ncbi:hypothetical protein [Sporosarcina sp. UB5]|uniref:hypothetical protein n=1 Tax=Sporosarcina sp. UB5 TaxID=3047463 RepID=UPI003D78E7ED
MIDVLPLACDTIFQERYGGSLSAGGITLSVGDTSLSADGTSLGAGRLALSAGGTSLSASDTSLSAGGTSLSAGDISLSAGGISLSAGGTSLSAGGITLDVGVILVCQKHRARDTNHLGTQYPSTKHRIMIAATQHNFTHTYSRQMPLTI